MAVDDWGGYRLVERVGSGTFGEVWRASHRSRPHLRRVALKRALATGGARTADLLDEARAIAALRHEHVVALRDVGEHDGRVYVAMEMMDGGTLRALASQRGLLADQACALLLAVGEAVDHGHRHGILHGDVKPANVLMTLAGGPKLGDFGVAGTLGAPGPGRAATGTPEYMAPERARDGRSTPATDVFSLGVMLYELLSGRRPAGDPALPLLALAPAVPTGVAEVCDLSIARDPERRPQTARAFVLALAEAATAAWGPGWVDAAGHPVHLPQPVRRVVTRYRRPAPAHWRPHRPTAEDDAPTVLPAPGAPARGGGGGDGEGPAWRSGTVLAADAGSATPATVARLLGAAAGADAAGVGD
ncbi:MAG TPA: serine/threonine-protein kinase, partial [Acidimicrobiales bacterium]